MAGVLLRAPLRGDAALSPDFVKIAEAYGLAATMVTRAVDVGAGDRGGARGMTSTAIIEFQVEQEDTVYPMVPAGADLHAMIRRPSPLVETAEDA